ncbi:MAG: hypothetical protein RLZZ557_1156 [Bacteroidota bacterium]|jgi:uncharacterized membrane-anchored protein YitT (DUF2179 family)
MHRKTSPRRKLSAASAEKLLLFKNWIYISLGVLSAGFGLKSFLLPNHFVDGGATGISLLLTQVTGLPFSWILLIINSPFLIMGYRQYGKTLFFSTLVAITALALAVTLIPYPMITEDKLLVATFGGFFLGAGIGMAMRGGSVLDGTEILALFISRKVPATIGDIILVFNIIIFSFAAYILGIEFALYSVLTYLVASKAVDFFVEGIEEYTGITIVSNSHAEAISTMLIEQFGRGVTTYKGSKGNGKKGVVLRDTDIIFTAVTRLEVAKIKSEILLIDPEAFVVINSVREIMGGMIKRRPLHGE